MDDWSPRQLTWLGAVIGVVSIVCAIGSAAAVAGAVTALDRFRETHRSKRRS
jgi:hypothetical protein